jgi:hypothetical protein
MCALSEVVWLGKQNRSFDGFKLRLKKHLYRLGSQNYNFRMPD